MPKIPLYGEKIGATPLAAGSLGPRASIGAFTAPGRATAGFAKAAGDVAFRFGMAEKKAETERVLAESISQESTNFDDFKRSQPARTVPGYNIVAREFKDDALARIDGLDLTQSQKQAVKIGLGKTLDIKINSERGNVFNKNQLERKNTFIDSINAMKSDAADPNNRESVLSDINYLIDFARTNGFDTGIRLDAIRYDLDKKDHLADRENPSLTLEYFETQLSNVNKGEGKYSGYTSSQQRETAGLIQNQIKFMKTGLKAQADQDAQTSLNNILLTGNRGEEGDKAVAAYRRIGDEQLANELDMKMNVGESVYSLIDSLAFASPQEVQQAIDFQEDLQEDLIKQGKSTEVVYRREAMNKAIMARQEQITTDPARYVSSVYDRQFDTEPTKAQQLEAQRNMGISDANVKLLSGSEVKGIISSVNNAQTTDDVQRALAPISGQGELTGFMMRQLSKNGLPMASMYAANQPDSPSSQLLLEANAPGALTINISPTNKSYMDAAVMNNKTVQDHLNSMLGGSYADFNNNQILGSVSNTAALGQSRRQHVDMVSNLAFYLIQEDGKAIGADGLSVAQFDDYVEQASTVLSERFSYIGGFSNNAVTLRIPAALSGQESRIKAALDRRVESITPSTIFFDNNTYEPGSKEFLMSREEYVDRIKGEYGWIIDNDGMTAIMVDGFGGIVFDEEDKPLTMNLMDALNTGEKMESEPLRPEDDPEAFGYFQMGKDG